MAAALAGARTHVEVASLQLEAVLVRLRLCPASRLRLQRVDLRLQFCGRDADLAHAATLIMKRLGEKVEINVFYLFASHCILLLQETHQIFSGFWVLQLCKYIPFSSFC